MPYYKKLVGERIYLSPMDSEDVEKFTTWLNDLETTLNLQSAPRLISREAEQEFLRKLSSEGFSFAMVNGEADELMGSCGLLNVDQVQRSAELGIFIGEKKYRGMGYGTEAIRLVLEFGFNLLNLHSIYLRVRSFNEAGYRCYTKVGFREIGRRRECVLIGGKYFDEIYMDILDREFQGSNPAIRQVLQHDAGAEK